MNQVKRWQKITDLFFRLKSQKPMPCEVCGCAIPAGETIFAYQGLYFHRNCAIPIPAVKATLAAPQPEPPKRKKHPKTGPSYAVDHESISYAYSDPLLAIETIVDATSRPGWNRDTLCFRCENWNPKKGLLAYPSRFGAEDSTVGCSGCLYSHLDEIAPAPTHKGYGRRNIRELRVM